MDRDERLAKQYTSTPVTLEDLGVQEGITRERVRQILAKRGISGKDGNRRLSNMVRREMQHRERMDRHCLYSYGCTFSEVKTITGRVQFQGLRNHPLLRMWWHHRSRATRLQCGWQFTLQEYAELIGPRLLEIGLKKNGLVLFRKDPSQPYSKQNCELISLSESSLRTNGFEQARILSSKCRRARTLELIRRAVEMSAAGATRDEIAKALRKSRQSIDVYFSKAKSLGLR